jgi:hypothetical protein
VLHHNKFIYHCQYYSSLVTEGSIMDAQKVAEYTTLLDLIITKAKNLKRGDSVSWNSSGGTARGKITKIVSSGTESIPNSSFTITGTTEDPGALIRVYQQQGDGYKPTDTIVGHKVSSLTKISTLD